MKDGSAKLTQHGGDLAAACTLFGGTPAEWLDLSTGINPHQWPGAQQVAIDWHRLPDPEALAELEAAAAAHFGAPSTCVCAVPGTELALRLLGEVLPSAAAHVVPSYRTHADAIAGSEAIADHDVAAALRQGRTVLLANPNNPDGLLRPADMLHAIAAIAADQGGWLVVDEAFADTHPQASVAPLVAKCGRLIVLRSFGKFFGLAGVRLGFVVAPPEIVARYRVRLGSWPVSAAAIAIGRRAYEDAGWIAAMRNRLRREADALDAMLGRHGLIPRGACPLFRLVETPAAAALFERLARAMILTRPFDDNARWLRIGLAGSDAALARLDEALGDG